MRRTATVLLACVLATTACSSDASEADVAAAEACDEYATFVLANLAKESDTAVILDRAIERAEAAADADSTHAGLRDDMTSRRQVAVDLATALAKDETTSQDIGAVVELMSNANVNVSAACAELGVTVEVIG